MSHTTLTSNRSLFVRINAETATDYDLFHRFLYWYADIIDAEASVWIRRPEQKNSGYLIVFLDSARSSRKISQLEKDLAELFPGAVSQEKEQRA